MERKGKINIWAVVFAVIIVVFIVNVFTMDSITIYVILAGACAGAIMGEQKDNTLLPNLLRKKRKKK